MTKDKFDKGTVDMARDWYYHTKRFQVSERLEITDPFVNLLTTFEGVKYKAYQDPVGIWTIGVGFIDGVKEGDTMTPEEVKDRLKKEVKRFEDAVNKHVHVPLTQYQFNALVSFAYNVGAGALAGSTLLQKLNEEDYDGSAKEFLRWNKAGGRVLKGLTRRRRCEKVMFNGGEWEEYI